MKSLALTIENLRGIKHLELELPLQAGLYAITGKNGSGKSTAMAAIANLFYGDILKSYFIGCADEKSVINYNFKNINKKIRYKDEQWQETSEKIYIHGFYEGSLIHGNRFRDVYYTALVRATKVRKEELIDAPEYVKENLGLILHNDKNHYSNLKKMRSDSAKKLFSFRSSPYFLLDGDKLISQLSLSTGENLLLSLLHSIFYTAAKRIPSEHEYLILLDEVELALHPIALIRLLNFLHTLSKQQNAAIYFSTHSTDLIKNISPNKIFFLNKHADRTVEVITPCYPAYATRNIYMNDGYDYVILVEDVLAKKIINGVLLKEGLLKSKLVHILPSGGWDQVLSIHKDIQNSKVLGSSTRIMSMLDGDSKSEFEKKKGEYSNLNIDFLPIKSLEKYLKEKLIDNVDHKFFREFNDTFFHRESLENLIDSYRKGNSKDEKGKGLLKVIANELSDLHQQSYDASLNKIADFVVVNMNIDPISDRLKNMFG